MTSHDIAIDGLDLADARRRIESSDLLVELLLEFSARWASGAERLEAALAAGERARAEGIAHALSGVAGTLGLVELRDLASVVERQLAEGVAVDADLPAMAAALARVTSSIDRALGSAAPPATPADDER